MQAALNAAKAAVEKEQQQQASLDFLDYAHLAAETAADYATAPSEKCGSALDFTATSDWCSSCVVMYHVSIEILVLSTLRESLERQTCILRGQSKRVIETAQATLACIQAGTYAEPDPASILPTRTPLGRKSNSSRTPQRPFRSVFRTWPVALGIDRGQRFPRRTVAAGAKSRKRSVTAGAKSWRPR